MFLFIESISKASLKHNGPPLSIIPDIFETPFFKTSYKSFLSDNIL